jgi:hypothetical protein
MNPCMGCSSFLGSLDRDKGYSNTCLAINPGYLINIFKDFCPCTTCIVKPTCKNFNRDLQFADHHFFTYTDSYGIMHKQPINLKKEAYPCPDFIKAYAEFEKIHGDGDGWRIL